MEFEKFVECIKEHNWEIYGIEVHQEGKLLHQYNECQDERHFIYSATKTITSLAAGIAVDEGKFSLDESIYEYLKSDIPAYASDNQKESLKKISIKRLLTMSVAGFPFRPEGNNWLESALTCPITDVEKKKFAYSNVSAYLVGVALEKAVGKHLYQYMCPRLFEPLKIYDPVYAVCPSGHFYGATGMQLTVNELSKIGQLMLQKGNFDGMQIVSKSYIDEATTMWQSNRDGGYGYFVWMYKDGYSINGKWGQRCIVLPDKGMIITYLSHMEQESELLMNAVEEYLL